MSGRELFSEIEYDIRIPERPLGSVSNHVVEVMPSQLQNVREGGISNTEFTDRCQKIVEGMEVDPLNLRDSDLDVALLDLKMMEAAIVHSRGIAPGKLTNLVDQMSSLTNQPSGITYEEIVLINPQLDKRTFTNGRVGQIEADFYEGHRRIEVGLVDSREVLEQNITLLQTGTPQVISEAAMNFREFERRLYTLVKTTEVIGMNMSKEGFAQFRQYLGTHPGRGTKGPSGAFTPVVPVIELYLAGDRLPPEYFNYLKENEIYFPRRGRLNIASALSFVHSGQTVNAVSNQLGNPKELQESIEAIGAQVRKFRGNHYKAVRHQIPGAIAGNISGTGGEDDPGTFLRNRMKIKYSLEK